MQRMVGAAGHREGNEYPRSGEMGSDDSILTRIKELPPVRAVGRRVVAVLDERERRKGARPPRREGAWALERLHLFDAIPEDELLRFGHDIRVEEVARRHTRVLDADGSHVWLVVGGSVKLCRVSVFGRRIVEALLERGDVFGRISNCATPVSYELQTLERTRIATLPRAAFEAILRRHADIAFAVVQTLEDRQRQLVRRIEALVFKDVRARVAETLLDLVGEHAEGCAHGFAVDLRITQQDLADLVGASRQMVNRVLGELSRELYVHRTGRIICILHRERLSRLAEGQMSGMSTG